MKHSLSSANTLQLVLFLEKKVQNCSDLKLYAVETFSRALTQNNHELAFHLFLKYKFVCFTDEFVDFCKEKISRAMAENNQELLAHLLSKCKFMDFCKERVFSSTERIKLVIDQTGCTEQEAIVALNLQNNDVVSAIMQLTPD